MIMQQAVTDYLNWKVVRSPRAAEVYKPYLLRLSDFKSSDTREISNNDTNAHKRANLRFIIV